MFDVKEREKEREKETEKKPETKQNRTGIPMQLKQRMEEQSGFSFDDVQVHYYSDRPAKLDALAYTQGNQVYIGPGQEQHLPHELGHVVQQKMGIVRANTRHSSGVEMNTEERLERQADEIGAGAFFQPIQRLFRSERVPAQRCTDGVVQAVSHIENVTEIKLASEHIELLASTMPTIVFESMGKDMESCKAIYNESKKYSGNTICVYGLNRKDGESPGSQQGGQIIKPEPNHLLYTFSFEWEKPRKASGGYEMPFVEARVLVMQKAKEITKAYTDGVYQGDGN